MQIAWCVRAVTSRNRRHSAQLIRIISRRTAGGAAQAPVESQKRVPKSSGIDAEKSAPISSSKTENSTSATLKTEKTTGTTTATADREGTSIKPEKSQTEAKPPEVDAKERESPMDLPKSTAATAAAAPRTPQTANNKLSLEQGQPPSPLPAPDAERVVSERIRRLADEIAGLTIFEVADLNSTLKKILNLPDTPMFASQSFTASAAAAVAAAHAESKGDGKDEKQSQQPQKTFFSVKLTKIDDSKKIPLIKEIRSMMEGFNLVQAKKFIEALPATVKEDMSKNEAEELKVKLEKLGATCEIV